MPICGSNKVASSLLFTCYPAIFLCSGYRPLSPFFFFFANRCHFAYTDDPAENRTVRYVLGASFLSIMWGDRSADKIIGDGACGKTSLLNVFTRGWASHILWKPGCVNGANYNSG